MSEKINEAYHSRIKARKAAHDKMTGRKRDEREQYRIRRNAEDGEHKWVLEDYYTKDGSHSYTYGYFSTWEAAHKAYLSQVS